MSTWLLEHFPVKALALEVRKKLRTVLSSYRSISSVCHTFGQLSHLLEPVEHGCSDVYFRTLGHILQHCAVEADTDSNVRVWLSRLYG